MTPSTTNDETVKGAPDHSHVSPSTDDAAAHVSAWNIANVLTMGRIVLVPFFGWALLADGGGTAAYRVLAWVLFAIAAITDRIDGDIARKRGLVTDFGKLMDPIADKALMGMAFIGLSLIGMVPWWATILVLVREIAVTLLRFVLIRRSHGVLPASRGGKIKTALQALAAGLFVLPLPTWAHLASWVVMAGAIVVTVVTGLDYFVQALRGNHAAAGGSSQTETADVGEADGIREFAEALDED